MKHEKKAIAILSTDWHLEDDNAEEIKDLIKQQCELAVSLGVKVMFCLGDIFNSRIGQRVSTLKFLSEILEIIHSYDLEFWAIPGNHDKQNYGLDESFIEAFKFHPKFKYISIAGGFPIGNIVFELLPFYKPDVWLERLNDLKKYIGTDKGGKKYVLLSHTAVNGSVNNDGTKIACNISIRDLDFFDLTLLGHYHDQQQISSNVFHIPSIKQNNFGENNEKGFTVFYDDCTFDLVKSKFKEYEKITIDFDKMTKTGYEALKKSYTNSEKLIRFEFIGSSDKIKGINKEELLALGISTSIKVKEIEDTIQYAEKEVKEYTSESIIEEFKQFCKEKDKDFETGFKYLSKKLN